MAFERYRRGVGSLTRMSRLMLVAGLVALVPQMAHGRGLSGDVPPLPFPMACPIDAPVRVASADTLKRFTALEGCRPGAVIVSPATELPRARGQVVIGASGSEADEAEGNLIFAEGKASAKNGRKGKRTRGAKPPSAIVDTGRIGESGITVIRIAPAEQFPEVEPELVYTAIAPERGVVVSAGPMTDAAILALRPASYTTPHDGLIATAAARHGVDPMMLHAVITQESRYRSSAVSHVGARGLMQVMPGTGAMLGVRNPAHLMDPATNIDAGARLLKRLWKRFSGRFDLVLAAYNAGEGAVTRYGMRIPPYRETQNYVVGVQTIYRKLVAERGLTYAGR